MGSSSTARARPLSGAATTGEDAGGGVVDEPIESYSRAAAMTLGPRDTDGSQRERTGGGSSWRFSVVLPEDADAARPCPVGCQAPLGGGAEGGGTWRAFVLTFGGHRHDSRGTDERHPGRTLPPVGGGRGHDPLPAGRRRARVLRRPGAASRSGSASAVPRRTRQRATGATCSAPSGPCPGVPSLRLRALPGRRHVWRCGRPTGPKTPPCPAPRPCRSSPRGSSTTARAPRAISSLPVPLTSTTTVTRARL
jgi:hypothetical protein